MCISYFHLHVAFCKHLALQMFYAYSFPEEKGKHREGKNVY